MKTLQHHSPLKILLLQNTDVNFNITFIILANLMKLDETIRINYNYHKGI